MTIVHIVLFKISSSLDESGVVKICEDMLSLKERCVNPQTQTPYIVRSSGGIDNSPEGLQSGLTHGFVVEFSSKQDRDYYVFEDPAHQAFIKSIDGKVGDLRVLDFEPGVY